jgi:hypothetical protein
MERIAVVFVSLTYVDDVFTPLAVKAFPNASYIQVDIRVINCGAVARPTADGVRASPTIHARDADAFVHIDSTVAITGLQFCSERVCIVAYVFVSRYDFWICTSSVGKTVDACTRIRMSRNGRICRRVSTNGTVQTRRRTTFINVNFTVSIA